MAKVQQRVLSTSLAVLVLSLPARSQKFYPDDPITAEPAPLIVRKAKSRKLSDYYNFFENTFANRGQRNSDTEEIRAANVNTVDEVPDSSWYTNRHREHRMSLKELVAGPGDGSAPWDGEPWRVVSAKDEGVTPGFAMEDGKGRRYLVKFDPMTNPEMATAADVIGSKFFYALGYNVPENYIIEFRREQIQVDSKATFVDKYGRSRRMVNGDIEEMLTRVRRAKDGRYRAVTSLFLPGKLLGPFRFHGVRTDDPNDVVPHEHRRELRALFVFCAWLNHTDSKELNTLDSLVEKDGLRYIRHYLIDFGAAFGSDSFEMKSPRAGHVYLLGWKQLAQQALSLGLLVPEYARIRYPDLPSVGRFEAAHFDPERWRPNYPNAAFNNRLPDDMYWAAKQVMAFSDEEIRAIVHTGRYSDEGAADWIADTLIDRRDHIGKAFFDKVLPLENLRVEENVLQYDDLGVEYRLRQETRYRISWSLFDNRRSLKTPLLNVEGKSLPDAVRKLSVGEYACADIISGAKAVSVFLRRVAGGYQVVGIERTW